MACGWIGCLLEVLILSLFWWTSRSRLVLPTRTASPTSLFNPGQEFDETVVENERLQETLRDKDERIEVLTRDVQRLEGENAKLRNDNERLKRKCVNTRSDSDMGSDSDNS